MFRGTGGPRRPQDEEAFFGMHPTRSNSDSVLLQPAASVRADVNASKWERATPISVGPVMPYTSRIGQLVPYGYQALSTRFKEGNVSPSILSQAADEGSRTGMKGSGILSSINVDGGTSDRNVPSASKHNLGNRIVETESSNSQRLVTNINKGNFSVHQPVCYIFKLRVFCLINFSHVCAVNKG